MALFLARIKVNLIRKFTMNFINKNLKGTKNEKQNTNTITGHRIDCNYGFMCFGPGADNNRNSFQGHGISRPGLDIP